ncbi:hydrogenase expression/formation protein [Acidihalobacter aeolianus]|uniref:Hydrogenase expression/formation protein n=1 Tax=Acidihalobacter aeolianus TaxID=2792603 RepID=A0A1D8K8Y8_9GAMM|nr:HyaD/HybD family hydrogenase maturation endopeptidase [Acidihalobacter aeolianus]AOV17433.1 hydrogenase expression/formation protein [Acidihalobacter aeolianus]
MSSTANDAAPQILILGIGNILWADEGFGVRAVDRLHREYLFPETVHLLDGGTQGLYLLEHVQDADILIVFDAVDYGLPPGMLKLIRDAEVPRFMGAKKMSLHQAGFEEVLATADLTGRLPERLVLIGVQPVELDDYGGSLREAVKAQIDPAIRIALECLDAFGIGYERRTQPLPETDGLSGRELTMGDYEASRPDADEAWRHGDSRFFNPLV